jgi:hypothetical protein
VRGKTSRASDARHRSAEQKSVLMNRKFAVHWMLFALTMIIASCGQAVPPHIARVTVEHNLYMTAAIATFFAPTPTNTPPSWATVIPAAGDLGWGSLYGRIVDATTDLPLSGATVRCEQVSTTSLYPCNGVTKTDNQGRYVFQPVYFHETDKITLFVEMPGYNWMKYSGGVTEPNRQVDLELPRAPTLDPNLVISCTAPVCNNGVLACGNPNGCRGGCGAICQIPSPTP